MGGTCGTYGEEYVVLWWENLKKGDHLKELVADGTIMIEWLLKEQDGRQWTGCV
jgi:hypothetical protein